MFLPCHFNNAVISSCAFVVRLGRTGDAMVRLSILFVVLRSFILISPKKWAVYYYYYYYGKRQEPCDISGCTLTEPPEFLKVTKNVSFYGAVQYFFGGFIQTESEKCL